MLPAFRLARPETLPQALEAIGEDSVPYCGGTELLLAMRAGLHRPDVLVDVKRLPELAGIRIDGEHLVIGAAERHMDVAAHELVRRHVPMLASVERAVGNARVRAQGSIGGNLCFAEPKSDVGTALIALGAVVTLVSPTGSREVAVESLIAGPYFADKEPDELLVDVRIPVGGPEVHATYVKFQTMERPTIGVALASVPEAGECRLVVGAVGEVPAVWRFGAPEEIDADLIAAAVDPTPDLTGSARYKRHVTGIYVRRALSALAGAGS
ncbi:MAG: FAD binding domain-containing protein [Motilibacteraceae bacterium]